MLLLNTDPYRLAISEFARNSIEISSTKFHISWKNSILKENLKLFLCRKKKRQNDKNRFFQSSFVNCTHEYYFNTYFLESISEKILFIFHFTRAYNRLYGWNILPGYSKCKITDRNRLNGGRKYFLRFAKRREIYQTYSRFRHNVCRT